MDRLVILAVAIVIAGGLSGGIYTTVGTQGTSMIVNRFTGSAWNCIVDSCSPARFRISN